MKTRLLVALTALVFSAIPPPRLLTDLIGVCHAADLSGAFSQGQAMGAAGNTTIQSNITAGQGAGVVPNYTSSATESGYFSGGQGSLFGPATGKISGCATGPKNPDPYQQQDCDAINFLARNPAQRQQFSIGKNDPLLTGAKSILANPAALDGAYSACSTQTVTQPAQFSTEVCNQYTDMTQSACQRVLTVTVSQSTIPATCGIGTWKDTGINMYTPDAFNRGPWMAYYCDGLGSNSIQLGLKWFWGAYTSFGWFPTDGVERPFNTGSWQDNNNFYVTISCGNDGNCTLLVRAIVEAPDAYGQRPAGGSVIISNPGGSVVTTISKSWDNQCATLEARAQ